VRGTYTLVLVCDEGFGVVMGRLGRVWVGAGCCLYTGSALGVGAQSLEGRVERHVRRWKRRRWHVDYLTSNQHCRVTRVVWLISPRRLECAINRAVAEELNARPVLAGAGSSDCECDAHLLRVQSSVGVRGVVRGLVRVYGRFGGRVRLMRFASSSRTFGEG